MSELKYKNKTIKVDLSFSNKKDSLKISGEMKIHPDIDEDGDLIIECFLLPESTVVINEEEVIDEQIIEAVDEMLGVVLISHIGKFIDDLLIIEEVKGNIIDIINDNGINEESFPRLFASIWGRVF